MRKRSKRLRSVDPWEEWRDEVTGALYYFHKHEENTHGKTQKIVKAEQQRNLWTRRYAQSSEIEKIGPWEIRQDDKNKVTENGYWWTNVETCEVFSGLQKWTKKTGVWCRKHALTRTQTEDEWKEMHEECDIMRGWSMGRIAPSPNWSIILFFHLIRTGFLGKARRTIDGRNKAWHRLGSKRCPEDWRRLRVESEVLRSVGDWSEYRNEETGIVFYFNSTSVQSLWNRPKHQKS